MEEQKETRVRLCLRDDTEEIVDDTGAMKKTDSNEILTRSSLLVKELENRLGKSEHKVVKQERSKGTYPFGGHDVLKITTEVLFVLASTGVIAGVFALLKDWLDLKKSRRVSIRIHTKEGEEVDIDVSGHKIDDVIKVAERSLNR